MEDVEFVAVSRWEQKQVAAAFSTWWELWMRRRQPRAVDGGVGYTYASRRRLRHAFLTWARDQISQQQAWEKFREGDANLPPPTPEVEQERKVAMFDLMEENSFALPARDDRAVPSGPYRLGLSIR